MKKSVLSILALALVCLSASAQDKFLLGGTGSNKIAIVNRQTQAIEWQYTSEDKVCSQCNSLVRAENGDVVFAHKKRATAVNAKGEILWEIKTKEGEELQCIYDIKGGYMIGIAGQPMRIVEVDRKGKVTKELTYDTGVDNSHRQFRQMVKTSKGTYVIPLGLKKQIIEISAKGELMRTIQLKEQSLYVALNKEGDWIATTGHAGDIYKIDNKSGKISTMVKGKSLGNGINIEFGAAIAQLKNGNYMLTNWVGHKGDQTQPILIELDEKGKVVWSMKKIKGLTYVAGIYPVD